MARQIRLNAMVANSPFILTPGVWRHPRDRSVEHGTARYWADLAKLLESGKFDGIFLADTMGVFDIYKDSAETAIRYALRIPQHDPVLTIPIMASVTENLGFGVTQNISYEHPYLLARRMATLDHLTDGRTAVNIVTGFQQSGAKAMGMATIKPHSDRYADAEEYMEVLYKLFEGVWEADAVQRDRTSGLFADPSKVHKVEHKGKNITVEGYSLVDPSTQRMPVIFQAGASDKGRAFAGKHAECIFMIEPKVEGAIPAIADIRHQAALANRGRDDIHIFLGATVIVGKTESEAQKKYEEYKSYVTLETGLAYMSGAMGIDLSKYDLDEPVPGLSKDDQIKSLTSSYTGKAGRAWTPREIAGNTVGGRQLKVVGSPEQVVDRLQQIIEQTDADGFNLSCASCPGDFEDFVDLVVPEMQRRGIYKTEYAAGNYREKLFGRSLLPPNHPGSRYRV